MHARRKYDEILKSLPVKDGVGSSALIGKQYCDKLFKLVNEYTDLTPEDRYENRLKYSKPVMDDFVAWAESLKTVPKTGIGKAVHDLLS